MLSMFRSLRTLKRIEATLRHQPVCQDCWHPQKFSIRKLDENAKEIEVGQAASLNCALDWVSKFDKSKFESSDSQWFSIYKVESTYGSIEWEGSPDGATDTLNDKSEYKTLSMSQCVQPRPK